MDRAAVDNLRNRIQRSRGGEMLLHVEDRDPNVAGDLRHVIDTLVAGYGYYPLRDGWFELSRKQAKKVLVWILLHDLVYGVRCKHVDQEHSAKLAEDFLSLFWANSRFFTNSAIYFDEDSSFETTEAEEATSRKVPYVPLDDFSSVRSSHSKTCHEIRLATFDSGVAVVDSRRVGILWFGDED